MHTTLYSLKRLRQLIPYLLIGIFSAFTQNIHANNWQIFDTEEFQVIYRPNVQQRVPVVVLNAIVSLNALKAVFDYTPSEKITIIIRDYHDTGRAAATPLPHNTITVDVSPKMMSEYELMRFDNSLRWLISHELVHIVIGDKTNRRQELFRSWFGKVEPVKDSPLSLFYSIITNGSRMTPAWYQEGIAVFMETWLNGGWGRSLGSFDEMYFRTLEKEQAPYLTASQVDYRKETFLLGMTLYLYGARFMLHLAEEYGSDKLIQWVKPPQSGSLSYKARCVTVFGKSLESLWQNFVTQESTFQQANLRTISQNPITPLHAIGSPLGWISQPFWHSRDNQWLFASFRPDEFASINALDTQGHMEKRYEFNTPTIGITSSLAFNEQAKQLFYTTHNNMGFRDLWQLDLTTHRSVRLQKDARITELAFNPKDQSLWAVRVSGSLSQLVRVPAPYTHVQPMVDIPPQSFLAQLHIDKQGKYLLGTLRNEQGKQKVIVSEIASIQPSMPLSYKTVVDQGNPELASFSHDGRWIYWNSYLSGVSNIFRRASDLQSDFEAISNTDTGLFHSLPMNNNDLFAFYFTSKGFQPVLLDNTPLQNISAIRYRGQDLLNKEPQLKKLRVGVVPTTEAIEKLLEISEPYKPLRHIKKTAIYPTVSGFNGQRSIGLRTEFKDKLLQHRATFDIGASKNRDGDTDIHAQIAYEITDRWGINLQHMPSSFYDLANERKFRRVEQGINLEHKHYWLYDRPREVTQSIYGGFNRWKTNDFGNATDDKIALVGTEISTSKERKTIGAVDFERGYNLKASVNSYQDINQRSQRAYQISGSASVFYPVMHPHNVFRLQTSGGISLDDTLDISQFYFTGTNKQVFEEYSIRRYRKDTSFAGLGEIIMEGDRYMKFGMENQLPPLAINQELADWLFVKNMDFSVFSQYLTKHRDTETQDFYNYGIQATLYFSMVHVMTSSLALGCAKAHEAGQQWSNSECYFALKIFRL